MRCGIFSNTAHVVPASRRRRHHGVCAAGLRRRRAVAGVLSMYNKLQELVFGKVYAGGSG